MTIEERLEAITQTLELTARTAQETEHKLGALADSVTVLKDRVGELAENMIVQGELMARLDRRLDEYIAHTDAWIETAETRLAELQVLVRTAHERLDQRR